MPGLLRRSSPFRFLPSRGCRSAAAVSAVLAILAVSRRPSWRSLHCFGPGSSWACCDRAAGAIRVATGSQSKSLARPREGGRRQPLALRPASVPGASLTWIERSSKHTPGTMVSQDQNTRCSGAIWLQTATYWDSGRSGGFPGRSWWIDCGRRWIGRGRVGGSAVDSRWTGGLKWILGRVLGAYRLLNIERTF